MVRLSGGVLVTPSIAPPQSGTGHGLLNFSTAPAYHKKNGPLFFTRVARRGKASPSRTASRSRSARPLMMDKGGKGAPPRPRSRQVHARLWGEGVGRGLWAEAEAAWKRDYAFGGSMYARRTGV